MLKNKFLFSKASIGIFAAIILAVFAGGIFNFLPSVTLFLTNDNFNSKLAQVAPPSSGSPSIDQYGGCMNCGVTGSITGYFHTQKISNRWYFIDPLGNPFWMKAVYALEMSVSPDDRGESYEQRVIRKYGDRDLTWGPAQNRRLLNWGFNAIGEYAIAYALPWTKYSDPKWPTGEQPVKLPAIPFPLQAAAYSRSNLFGYATNPVKDIIGPTDNNFTGYRGSFVDVYDPNFAMWVDGVVKAQGNVPNSSYFVGFSSDDSDYITGFGPGADFNTEPTGQSHSHVGYIALITPPTQNSYKDIRDGITRTYNDTKVYTKYALKDFLASKYGNIATLNSAWGSNYTTFDSSGGWPNGSGLLDENGKGSWIGSDSIGLTDTNLNVKKDLDDFLYQIAKKYFSVYREKIKQYYPNALFLGPTTIGGWGAPARRQILQAAGEYLDVIRTTALTGTAANKQAMLDFEAQYAGNVPLMIWLGTTANADSALFRYPGGTRGYFTEPTQIKRGEYYQNSITTLINSTITQTGVRPFIGLEWWQYLDNWGEKSNWGLVSLSDNAYDGIEAVISASTDQWGYARGGEEKNYGNFLGLVTQANKSVYESIFGITVSPAPPPSPQPTPPPPSPVPVPAGFAISTNSLPSGVVNTAYSAQLSATGGTSPYTWSYTGTMPHCTVLSTSGQISGNPYPCVAGTFAPTFSVRDANGAVVSKQLTIFIGTTTSSAPPPPSPLPPPSPSPTSGGLDQYGGCTNCGITGTVTGYFHRQKIGNRWYIIDPLGNPFWMNAVYNANPLGVGTKYVSTAQWASQAAKKMKTFGFNTIGEYSAAGLLPVPSFGASGGNTEKMPFIRFVRPSAFADSNRWGWACQPNPDISCAVKSLVAGLDTNIYSGAWGWRGSALLDIYDPNFELNVAGAIRDTATAQSSTTSAWVPQFWHKNTPQGLTTSPWVIGTSLDDADGVWGFKRTSNPHVGWMVLVTAPTQTGPYTTYGGTIIPSYRDTVIHSKIALRDFLKNRYGTISALNSAWGANYSTFDSNGGWKVGTGLLDENGRNSWTKTDYRYAVLNNQIVQKDLDDFMYEFAKKFFSLYIKYLKEPGVQPNHMVFTPAALHDVKPPILWAARDAGVDIVQLHVSPNFPNQAWQPGLDKLETAYLDHANKNFGGPIYFWTTFTSQADSPFTGQTNNWGPFDFPTQVERGAGYKSYISRLINGAASDGTYNTVGIDWWEWSDRYVPGDSSNFGFVTSNPRAGASVPSVPDNTYNGKEAIIASGIDPWGFKTGGEAKNYGDFITKATEANNLFYSTLRGNLPSSIPPPTPPPSIPTPSPSPPSSTSGLDQYGGCTNCGVKGTITGYFHTQKIGSRWHFITPLGNPYWMKAVYALEMSVSPDDRGGTYEQRVIAKYGDRDLTWGPAQNRRLLSWGFNAIGEYAITYVLPWTKYSAPKWPTGEQPVKLPAIPFPLQAAAYSRSNLFGYAINPVKDIIGPTGPYFTGYRGSFVDVYDPNFEMWINGVVKANGSTPNSPYFVGFSSDDSDYITGFGPGADFNTEPTGQSHSHVGYIALITPPTQSSYKDIRDGITRSYNDTKVYTKYALKDFLVAKYGSIGALNSAWGSNYTTFDSNGGWPNGSGLLDENGKGAWVGTDSIALGDTNSNVRTDLDNFLYQIAKKYFSVYRDKIKQYYPNALFLGPTTIGGWGAPARRQILQAAGEYLDVVRTTALTGTTANQQAMLNFTAQYAGDVPLMIWLGTTANADSALYRYPGGTRGYFTEPTQAKRGEYYQNAINTLVNATVTQTGNKPFIGLEWWQYLDNWGEKSNWGLVSLSDNAYDGKEAIIAPSIDQWGYPRGGEERNYGDFLSAVKQGNISVYQTIFGVAVSSSPPPTPSLLTSPPPSVSTPTSSISSTQKLPDLVITDIQWTPLSPEEGDELLFSATVKNQGTTPTPSGVIIGVGFFPNKGRTVTWSSNKVGPLAAGSTITLTSSGGASSTPYWKAIKGDYSLYAYVDDVNRISESDETNNIYYKPLRIATSTTRGTTINSFQFGKNLKLGMSDPEVYELQKALNKLGFALASTGPGSPGNETSYFGRLTYNAVVKFQEKYTAEILIPNGLKRGTGYFGPSTRAKLNSL